MDEDSSVPVAPNSNKKLGADLWLACRNGEFDKVQNLVARGAPVNFKFVSRQPKMRPYPLHVAVFRNRADIVQFLLSKGGVLGFCNVFLLLQHFVPWLIDDGSGADPLLRNYRKETALDLARQNNLHEMLALLERGPTRVLPVSFAVLRFFQCFLILQLQDRASTTANRERDIKQVRKQEQPDETLGPVSKAEIIANVAKYKVSE